jgi:hypothetical protein
MSDDQATQSSKGEPEASARCVCHEVFDHFSKCFEISPPVRQHLTNSRVEFLKAIRAVIDQRIENLSSKPKQGSRIAVE